MGGTFYLLSGRSPTDIRCSHWRFLSGSPSVPDCHLFYSFALVGQQLLFRRKHLATRQRRKRLDFCAWLLVCDTAPSSGCYPCSSRRRTCTRNMNVSKVKHFPQQKY